MDLRTGAGGGERRARRGLGNGGRTRLRAGREIWERFERERFRGEGDCVAAGRR